MIEVEYEYKVKPTKDGPYLARWFAILWDFREKQPRHNSAMNGPY